MIVLTTVIRNAIIFPHRLAGWVEAIVSLWSPSCKEWGEQNAGCNTGGTLYATDEREACLSCRGQRQNASSDMRAISESLPGLEVRG